MKMDHLDYVWILLAMLVSQAASAEIYKWVDENGEVQYSQSKPDAHEAKQMNISTQPAGNGGSGGVSSSATSPAQMCNTQESVVQYGSIYCCTASCVTKMRSENLSFTCATQKCYEALIDSDAEKRKAREEEARKAKIQAEQAQKFAEAEKNRERLQQEERDRKIAISRRARGLTN